MSRDQVKASSVAEEDQRVSPPTFLLPSFSNLPNNMSNCKRDNNKNTVSTTSKISSKKVQTIGTPLLYNAIKDDSPEINIRNIVVVVQVQ